MHSSAAELGSDAAVNAMQAAISANVTFRMGHSLRTELPRREAAEHRFFP
jgi:hypothetical protein